LWEFSKLKIEEVLTIFEKEKDKFYVHCLKRDKDILVYDKNKNTSKPEEIIRQLWLVRLIKDYRYPLDRIELEKIYVLGEKFMLKRPILLYIKKIKSPPILLLRLKALPKKKELIN